MIDINKIMKLKPIINKANGQINISIPKKSLSENMKKNILKGNNISVILGEWKD